MGNESENIVNLIWEMMRKEIICDEAKRCQEKQQEICGPQGKGG